MPVTVIPLLYFPVYGALSMCCRMQGHEDNKTDLLPCWRTIQNDET